LKFQLCELIIENEPILIIEMPIILIWKRELRDETLVFLAGFKLQQQMPISVLDEI
jgi:hypothetical protein